MNLDSHFLAIWLRSLNEPNLTVDLIQAWAIERGLCVSTIDEREVGEFRPTRSIVLTIENGHQACFPLLKKDAESVEVLQRLADHQAALWEKMEWFSPLWVSMNKLGRLLKETEGCTPERSIEVFDHHTSTIYTLAFQAVCIEQIMPKARSLREFCPIAREAYLAFYSGYRASSISALIPLIEGSLSRIVSSSESNLSIGGKIDRAICRAIDKAARLHFGQMWIPREYLTIDYLFSRDERIFVFETFRRWLHNSFFRKSDEYAGATWLNRHLFAHATSAEWQQSANFSRLIVSLATLGVIEAWHDESNAVSLFFPDMNEESRLLWDEALFQAEAQFALNVLREKRYHEFGRLVPEMPTDDGVLLRKAILSDECIKDLVRPLRNAGWSVSVGEPDDRSLYMTVVASCGGERLEVSLLYSCATDNGIYRRLAETSKVILYRGAPYHQEQYAYGLTIHVGPVAGWQPPRAPIKLT